MAVLRYPAIILVGLFFALGPAPFERLHVDAANKSLARMKALMERDSHSGSKPPMRPPAHDPSTCVICAALHSPITAHHVPAIAVGPIAFIGYIHIEGSSIFLPISNTPDQCRGPPSV